MAKPRTPPKGKKPLVAGDIAERLEPLAKASPGRSRGRIRTLAEARQALKIALSSEAVVLAGVPADGQLVSFPVSDRTQPELVAEFACLRVTIGHGRNLAAAPRGTRLKKREKSNALWVVHGAIALTADNALVISTLNVGTAFGSQLTTAGDDPAAGITSELLRLLSPSKLLRETVAQLEATDAFNRIAARLGATPIPPEQQHVLAKITQAEKGRGRPPIPDNELVAIALRYTALLQRGIGRPHAELGAEFNLSPGQVRNRISKARERGYLAKTKRGLASSRLGPKLTDA